MREGGGGRRGGRVILIITISCDLTKDSFLEISRGCSGWFIRKINSILEILEDTIASLIVPTGKSIATD